MSRPITRRTFLRYSSLAAAAAAACPLFSTAQDAARKLNVAFVGVGGRGWGDLEDTVNAGCNVVALCDVDANHLANAAKAHPKAKTYADYRKMLEEQKDIEAVVVATPDHHHFPASMMAIKLGKHVYCEKPLTHSVWEARQIAQAAKQAGVATQMGTQAHASEAIRLLVEWIQAGAIGAVKEVHIWTDRAANNWWPQGVDRPDGQDPVPASLDWDLWIGPAPLRPYKSKWTDGPFKGRDIYHPFVWRGWWDFGTCALGDIGCHALDWAWWSLNLTAPTSVEAVSSEIKKESGPLWSNVAYQFPANGARPALKLFWYDGRCKTTPKDSRQWKEMAMLHELAQLGDRELPENGQLYVGDKGMILSTGAESGPRLTPESRMKDFKRPDKTLPRNPLGHHGEWLAACKGGQPAGSNFAYAGPLAEAVLLGNVALRFGKKIEWDSANLKAANAPEADALIRTPYRKGWEV